WNEYGIGKANLRAGLPAPLSGSVDNRWKHSNGAWIRSEIWACVAPACPDLAARL
ncbi:MAG TPA: ADP-ribosylglycohydrolase family protein, partial [Armatimonadetes bacterium]|nr:ADP-ribosylglycohydrolase family protein [Armatimonadota bacterium]